MMVLASHLRGFKARRSKRRTRHRQLRIAHHTLKEPNISRSSVIGYITTISAYSPFLSSQFHSLPPQRNTPQRQRCTSTLPPPISPNFSHLIIPLIPNLRIPLPLRNNLLTHPLLLETHRHLRQIRNNILATLHHRILGRDAAIRRDAQVERREERVGYLVRGEGDVRVLEEALGYEVPEGVIFFVEGEDLGVGDL